MYLIFGYAPIAPMSRAIRGFSNRKNAKISHEVKICQVSMPFTYIGSFLKLQNPKPYGLKP